jgi:N-acetylneuraminic acid mutarotase
MSKHTATIVDEEGIMLVFGGDRNGIVYELDLTEMKWRTINNVCYQRKGHSANRISDSIYLFGGLDGNCKNDIHKYDIKG